MSDFRCTNCGEDYDYEQLNIDTEGAAYCDTCKEIEGVWQAKHWVKMSVLVEVSEMEGSARASAEIVEQLVNETINEHHAFDKFDAEIIDYGKVDDDE